MSLIPRTCVALTLLVSACTGGPSFAGTHECEGNKSLAHERARVTYELEEPGGGAETVTVRLSAVNEPSRRLVLALVESDTQTTMVTPDRCWYFVRSR
jgi:hypothetical protein